MRERWQQRNTGILRFAQDDVRLGVDDVYLGVDDVRLGVGDLLGGEDVASKHGGEDGFLLVAVIVATFLILLALSAAAPVWARQLKREKELESQHRAQQYVRAIRVYQRKFHTYPGSIEALKKTNNQRFLRQEYVDPLTGKADWRLIHVGENQTKVKGFFGEDLPGLPGTGIKSSLGTSSIGTQAPPPPPGTTGPGGTTAPVGTATPDPLKATGGFIMGIGSAKTGESLLTVNEKTTYQEWEFLYDPAIEQLYAKGALNGGIKTGAGSIGIGGLNGGGTGGPGTTPAPGGGKP